MIPLAHISQVQLPDYEKVDVGANGFSMTINPLGVDLKSISSSIDPSELDYCMYASTDSSHFHEVWLEHMEEAIEQCQENMNKRKKTVVARMNRRVLQSLSRHSSETSGSSAPAVPSGVERRRRS